MEFDDIRGEFEKARENTIANARTIGLGDDIVPVITDIMTMYGRISIEMAEIIADCTRDLNDIMKTIFSSAKDMLLEEDRVIDFISAVNSVADKYGEMVLPGPKLYLDVATSYVSRAYRTDATRKILPFSFMSMSVILMKTLDNACEMRDDTIQAGERAIISDAVMGGEGTYDDQYMNRWKEIEGFEDEI